MADLMGNNKLLGEEDEKQGQTSGTMTPGASSAGFISGAGGSSSQSQQSGPGGTGGWTNIQSYLSANKGGTGSEKLLEDKVGKTLDTERDNIYKTAEDVKTKANQQVDAVKESAKNAKSWVDQAANAYSWDNNYSQDYTDKVSSLEKSLRGAYSGPTQYNYAIGSDAQRYGTALSQNPSFNNLMSDLYREAAGGEMTRGSADLQNQLDVSNDALAKSRQELLQRYANLDSDMKTAAEDTGSAIEQARTNYGAAQNSLADQLTNYASQMDSARAKAEADARAAYNRDLNSASGYKNYYVQGVGSDIFAPNPDDIRAAGNDATWQQIADYQMPGVTIGDRIPYRDRAFAAVDEANRLNQQSKDALNSFYQTSDSKYSATGDAEKRRFNTIMDILDKEARRNQGFTVRG